MDRKQQKIQNTKKLLKNAQEALLDEIERTTDAITELKDLTSKKTNTELLVAFNNLQGEMAKQKVMKLEGVTQIKGDKGDLPVKGKDYFTEQEIKEFLMKSTPIKNKDYFDGENGYTPIKGIDYFDGKDGRTPIKGKDYFDGKDGKEVDETELIKKIIKKIPEPKNGKNGRPPKHEYKYGQLRFENPDGTWGEWINLREYASFGGKTIHRGGASFVDDETPAGTINGVNNIFTLAKIPIDGSLKLFVNGARMRVTEDYTLSSQTITFVTAPPTGSILIADYRPQ